MGYREAKGESSASGFGGMRREAVGLAGRSEGEIVRAVRDELVAEGFEDGGAVNEEDAGHALDVAFGHAQPVTAERGPEHPRNAARVEELVPFHADQAEFLIEAAIGIGESREVFQVMGGEVFAGALIGGEVDKREPRAQSFHLRAKFFEFGDGLTAKSAAEVAEEDKQDGLALRERGYVLSRLREIGMNKLGKRASDQRHG